MLDSDAQWESPEVAKSLGIDHDGTQLRQAVKSATGLQEQRAALTRLQRTADVTSYIACEALEQDSLRWKRNALKDDPQLHSLEALFDVDELSAALEAVETAADRKAGPGEDAGS